MSVKIRLTKIGKRNQIQFRIVAQDTHTKRDGKFLEILGNFNPSSGEKLTLKKDQYEAWLKKGAKPTPSLSYLLENGKLPKKAKKPKVEPKAPDQKPPEAKDETQASEDKQAPQEEPEIVKPEQKTEESVEETKNEATEKSEEPNKSNEEPKDQKDEAPQAELSTDKDETKTEKTN